MSKESKIADNPSAKDIIEQPQVLQLKQLILLDPYYTPNFLKIDVGNKRVAIAKYDKEQIDKVLGLDPRLAFSFYRSSTLSSGVSGDANLPLQREAAYLRICPVYLDHIPKSDRSKWEHITAAYVYLYSKQFDSAYSIASSDSFKHSYPSANSDAKQIKALMGQTRTCYLDDFSKGCSDVSVGDVCS